MRYEIEVTNNTPSEVVMDILEDMCVKLLVVTGVKHLKLKYAETTDSMLITAFVKGERDWVESAPDGFEEGTKKLKNTEENRKWVSGIEAKLPILLRCFTQDFDDLFFLILTGQAREWLKDEIKRIEDLGYTLREYFRYAPFSLLFYR